jgi:hypothetical protein
LQFVLTTDDGTSFDPTTVVEITEVSDDEQEVFVEDNHGNGGWVNLAVLRSVSATWM